MALLCKSIAGHCALLSLNSNTATAPGHPLRLCAMCVHVHVCMHVSLNVEIDI